MMATTGNRTDRRTDRIKRAGVLLAASLAATAMLGACGPNKVPLPGDRVSVLQQSSENAADPTLGEIAVRLPKPYVNSDWAQVGGNQAHAMYHLQATSDILTEVWSADIGSSADSTNRLLAEPVVADGMVYTLDAEALVRAFDANTGARVWQADFTPEDEDDDLFGGGMALAEGKIFVTTPYAKVYALDAKTGAFIWEAKAPAPMRAAPTVSDGRVFVTTIDNQLVAFALDDGRRLWSNAGVEEAAGLLGGSTPAVLGNVVVAAYTSGELLAFDVVNGNSLWTDSLAGKARTSSVAALSDIRGRPVIDRDRVIAIGNGGVMAAIDVRRGERYWDKDLGGTQMPWAAGDFIYLVTSQSEVVCLTRDDGKIKWLTPLPPFEDMEYREDPIYWSGPVLVGDRLLVTGSNGLALSISPYTGALLGKQELPDRSHLPPVVANEMVYMLSDDADLIALK
ncbi:PQQ-binding-like beta-propeller repeat protein [Dongia sp.]|uniref:outer membrane protein assembly factor BamB family protein n=1 Tax=Dongia sp. TaxID=1977262 RepID=UPI0035AE56DD